MNLAAPLVIHSSQNPFSSRQYEAEIIRLCHRGPFREDPHSPQNLQVPSSPVSLRTRRTSRESSHHRPGHQDPLREDPHSPQNLQVPTLAHAERAEVARTAQWSPCGPLPLPGRTEFFLTTPLRWAAPPREGSVLPPSVSYPPLAPSLQFTVNAEDVNSVHRSLLGCSPSGPSVQVTKTLSVRTFIPHVHPLTLQASPPSSSARRH